MHDSRGAGIQIVQIEAGQFERPAGCAITSGETAPYILMRVDEQVEPVFSGFSHHARQVIQVLLIVNPGTLVFDRFPGDQESQEVESPRLQTLEMFIRFLQREGSSDEGHLLVIEESFAIVGCPVWHGRHFGTATQVDTAQHGGSSAGVDESGSGNGQVSH